MIHERAVVSEEALLPDDIQVWAGAIVEPAVIAGRGCVIGSNVFVGAGTSLGNRVRIQHGAFIPRRTRIGHDVFIGPNVTMTDDKYPMAGSTYDPRPPILEHHCSIGAGAVLLPGVTIGHHAMVAAGAVVTKNVFSESTVIGVPAK